MPVWHHLRINHSKVMRMASSTSVRFPDPLKAEAMAYADSLGLSLNALCAVALRDYLDARARHPAATTPTAVPSAPIAPAPERKPKPKPLQASPAPEPDGLLEPKVMPGWEPEVRGPEPMQARQGVPASASISKPAGGVNQPCPCGSGEKWKRCHGKT